MCMERAKIRLERWKEKLGYNLLPPLFCTSTGNKKLKSPQQKYNFNSCGVVWAFQKSLAAVDLLGKL